MTAIIERPTKSVLEVIDKTGDTKVEWDKDNPAEVEIARAAFNAAKDKKYLAYNVPTGRGRPEVIREFDPSMERIVLKPQMAGG